MFDFTAKGAPINKIYMPLLRSSGTCMCLACYKHSTPIGVVRSTLSILTCWLPACKIQVLYCSCGLITTEEEVQS